MVGKLLARGMLAGLVAGLLAFVFGKLFAEPSIATAIGFEDRRSHDDGPELVSRATQSGFGLAVAVLVFGLAIGGIYALVFALAHGRIGTRGPMGTSAVLGIVGFTGIYFVPFLKYPANPPAVGAEDTIGERTGLYFGMVFASVVLGVCAILVYRRLAARIGVLEAGLLAAVGYVVLASVVATLLPGMHEVPNGFPADTLWRFRTTAVGTQAVLWLVLTVGFGYLAQRMLEPARASKRQALAA